MAAISRRDALGAVLIALLASALFAAPPFDRLRGLSIDLLTSLRWTMLGSRYDPSTSPAVVVALDEETYNTPPFNRTPAVTWTREMAKVLNAIIEGGAKVVGFDIIFPNSIEQSEIPFGEETLGARLRGFDRDFLRSLALAARADKVVLGQIQHQEYPIQPADSQRVAVGQQRNMRPLNLHTDADDIVRRMPITLETGGEMIPAMPVELAARALGTPLGRRDDGTATLGGRIIPSNVANTFGLNFEGGGQDIPTYSLADLKACADQGRSDFFRREFDGRVVLIGTVLDIEDRKVTSKRFSTGLEGSNALRCALPKPGASAKFERDSIAGVYIHATAVNNLMRGDTLIELPRGWQWAGLAAVGVATAGGALILSPAGAALTLAGLLLTWTGVAVLAFAHGLVLPLTDTAATGVSVLLMTIGYRLAIVDRDKRFLRKSFALYLPPALIDSMLASNKPPALGGEIRDVTVYFSDIAGFSQLSEKMSPEDLVALMNGYLSAMTDIVEAHGGFVDKYIGDAIVAIFGAPIDEGAHARNAVRAALACNALLTEMNRSGHALFKGHVLAHRIGLNSGRALIGNIGSRRRFNYTAMGDTVNVAARLEGANKFYGTTIIASADTVSIAGDTVGWREIDVIRAAGLTRALSIYSPLAEAGDSNPPPAIIAEAYSEGLSRWRARDFSGAAEAFQRFAESDPPSARFLERARRFVVQPPALGWEPINHLEEK